jgi:ATP-dependent protease ClpP protease subunit
MEDVKNTRILEISDHVLLRENRIISISGEISEGDGQIFLQDIEILCLDGNDPITIDILSPGGDIFEGFTIIRAIKLAQSKGIKVIGRVCGFALSMAFIILQCCNERKMGNYCVLMCHGATASSLGDIKDLDAQKKMLQIYRDFVSKIIATRNTSKKKDYKLVSYWYAILEDNTPLYYNSTESIETGLVDIVEN